MKTASILLITLCTLLSACQKDKKEAGITLKVLLTDNPVKAEAVNIYIQEVRVKTADQPNGTEEWITLDTRAGMYNLLELQNGVTTPLAQGTLPNGSAKEIRLVLGTNNHLVVNGQSCALTIPSGAESGLKIKLAKPLQKPIEEVVVDFDAALSIVQTGSNTYILKPVLRVK